MSDLESRSERDSDATDRAGGAIDPLLFSRHSDPVATMAGAPAVASAQLTRRGRVRKWDRPPPPHDWRWYVGNLGKILIATGLLMFGFVAYQLWGTAIETAAAQNGLRDDFEQLLADADVTVRPVTTPADDTGTEPVTQQPDAEAIDPASVVPIEDQKIPALEDGNVLARLEVPRIGVDFYVVAGVKPSDLKKGPGHFPDTPLPGQLGNAAIAGHRTSYKQPFYDVDKLEKGDEVRVTTLSGVFVYRVTGQAIVGPNDYEVVATTDPTRANLTLTSCDPKYTSQNRIVIFSELDVAASAAVGEPLLNYGRPNPSTPLPDERSGSPDESAPDPTINTSATSAPVPNSNDAVAIDPVDEVDATPQLGSAQVNASIADAFSDSWFSDPAANPQVGLWGLALAAIAIGAYLLSRKVRRDWMGLLVAILPFTFALYFFFQNVNRLLPPNL